jgi:hypothetical protein
MWSMALAPSNSWSKKPDDTADKRSSDAINRVFDFILALTALVILSPVLLVLFTIIKISSRGPVFYRGCALGVTASRSGSLSSAQQCPLLTCESEAARVVDSAESSSTIPFLGFCSALRDST